MIFLHCQLNLLKRDVNIDEKNEFEPIICSNNQSEDTEIGDKYLSTCLEIALNGSAKL